MNQTRFQNFIHIPGAAAANWDIRFTVPYDCRLVHVSAVGSNANDAELAIGISTDTNSILVLATIGDSATPVEKTVADWATTNPTGVINKGEIMVLTLDYDGDGGTAAADTTIVLTFLAG